MNGAKRTPSDVLACRNHFAVLGLEQRTPLTSVTDEDVRAAYRQLALLFHPDKSAAPNGEAAFVRVSEAYEGLRDGPKRAAHAQQVLAARPPASGAAPRSTFKASPWDTAIPDPLLDPEAIKEQLRRWKVLWAEEMAAERRHMAAQGPLGRAAFGPSDPSALHTAPPASNTGQPVPRSLLLGTSFVVREKGRSGDKPAEYSLWVSRDLRVLNWRRAQSRGNSPDYTLALSAIASIGAAKAVGPQFGFTLTESSGRVYSLRCDSSMLAEEWVHALRAGCGLQ